MPVRGIHLDLKGLPPTSKRLLQLLELLAQARINCVLVEWEDTYPWSRYPELRCETAYSKATVARFIGRADELGIEVIPLVQCFGHLQNVLAKPRFRHLRELPETVGEICPSRPGAREVIREMIDDVLETHGGRIRRLHLGGDEVWSLGSCPKCRRAVRERGKAQLYMRHVSPLLELLRKKGITPVLWDDMMRAWPMPELKKLSKATDLMAWSYRADPLERVKPEILDRYRAAGLTVWGASAFKGGDGALKDVCDLPVRTANTLAWVKAAKKWGFAGVVAAGWSRYSTFTVPCGGLEAALHSLVLAAAAMWDGALPPDAEKQARAFLRTGKRKALGGERFDRCYATSKDIEEWCARLPGLLENTRAAAHLAGETERFDPKLHGRVRRAWEGHLAAGRKLARDWMKAHSGLVPRVWLERYVESRLWLPRELGRLLGGRLESREGQ